MLILDMMFGTVFTNLSSSIGVDIHTFIPFDY